MSSGRPGRSAILATPIQVMIRNPVARTPRIPAASTIDPGALHEALTAGARPVLDVRSAREYRSGHVPGAVHVPFWLLPWRMSLVPASAGSDLVVYCGHGPRAWLAGRLLRRHGRRVVYLRGHMQAWRDAGLPLERGARD
jgi:rhodanese-related sulfurtransferase